MCQLCYSDQAKQFAFQLESMLDTNLNEQNSSAELLVVLHKATAKDIISLGQQVSILGKKVSSKYFCLYKGCVF